MKGGRNGSALLPAAGAVALWSTVAVAFKLALRETEPGDLVALSSFVSWAALGVALLVRRGITGGRTASGNGSAGGGDGSGDAPGGAGEEGVASSARRAAVRGTEGAGVSRRTLLFSALAGLLNPVLYYAVLFAAYDRLPAQAAQPLNYTWPVFLALLAAPMARRRPSVRELVGLAFGLCGVILISRRPGGVERLDPVGTALALGSGIVWAFYWLAGARLRIDGLLRLFVGFSAALVPLVPFWISRGAPVPAGAVGRIAVIWVGLFEMGLTFLLWNTALARADRPARIGSLVYVGPFVSLLWISLILPERIRPVSAIGLAVIIAGVLVGRSGEARRNGPGGGKGVGGEGASEGP